MPRAILATLLTISGLSLLAQVSSADVYKYTDAQGKVQYTDKPQTLPAERIGLQSRRTDAASAQERNEAERQRLENADEQRKQTAEEQTDQRQAKVIAAKDKAELCSKARERYDNYMGSQRIYESLPNNERRYLSDSELDKARATAKTAMETLCK